MKSQQLITTLALAIWLPTTTTVYAFGPQTPRRTSPAKCSKTCLAWKLPAPLEKSLASNDYWYQDIGCAIDRPVIYNDYDEDVDHSAGMKKKFGWGSTGRGEEESQEEVDLLKLSYAFLSLSEEVMDDAMDTVEDAVDLFVEDALDTMEDAMDSLFPEDSSNSALLPRRQKMKKRRFPVRMVCGAWNRIRRNPQPLP